MYIRKMPANTKIIQAIRESPVLYKGNCSLEERNRGWKKLAAALDMQERFLKTRWHFLSTGYKRAIEGKTYFKYMDAMEFLQPYVDNHKQGVQKSRDILQPEFVITEKDIETESDTEEFVFLEVETLESCVEENSMEMEEPETRDEDDANETQPIDPEQMSKQELENTLRAESITNDSEEEHVPSVTAAQVMMTPILESKKENTIVKSKVRNNNSNCLHNSNDETNRRNERCEDVIFGELVVAMIKRMPEDKKHSVKKEIMNLLFT